MIIYSAVSLFSIAWSVGVIYSLATLNQEVPVMNLIWFATSVTAFTHSMGWLG